MASQTKTVREWTVYLLTKIKSLISELESHFPNSTHIQSAPDPTYPKIDLFYANETLIVRGYKDSESYKEIFVNESGVYANKVENGEAVSHINIATF